MDRKFGAVHLCSIVPHSGRIETLTVRPRARRLPEQIGNAFRAADPLARTGEGGRSTFLESDSGWIERVRSECPPIDVRLVHYGTKRRDWKTLLQADPRKLRMDLPPDIAASSWDIIFVDAPPGYRDTHPGRMQSIYTAARLAHQHPPADVLVHDCNRTVERVHADRFLGSANLLAQVHDLRQYRLRGE